MGVSWCFINYFSDKPVLFSLAQSCLFRLKIEKMVPILTGLFYIFHYMTYWQREIAYPTFTKAVAHQIWQKKAHKIMYLFSRFKIYVVNTASSNELKLLGSCVGFCQLWCIRWSLSCFRLWSFHPFLKQKS